MSDAVTLLAYAAPLALATALYSRYQRRLHERSLSQREASVQAGLTQPASLHPIIDPLKCIGCQACLKACPEMPAHQVLGLIHGKAELVSPTDCIGHGACRSACPVGAISLVFGTATRGVDIPHVGPDFQTNVPGIYIAGELGGMGLIRNAIEQGRQAVEAIGRTGRNTRVDEIIDLLIIGAGPAGLSASLAAMERHLGFITIEQDSLGGTIAHYPRGKLVMTGTAHLPMVGRINLGETSKEALLGFWQKVQRDTGVPISFGERAVSVSRAPGHFLVRTSAREIRTRNVLLAIGRRGTPRQLGVPGEELSKVTYRLIDPEQYRNQRVLVIGGGDSALEAAASLSDAAAAHVVLSYRGNAFSRAKPANRARVDAAAAGGRLDILLDSQVLAIERDLVAVQHGNRRLAIANDAVIVSAGGILPTDFLKSMGVHCETKFGTA